MKLLLQTRESRLGLLEVVLRAFALLQGVVARRLRCLQPGLQLRQLFPRGVEGFGELVCVLSGVVTLDVRL